MRLVVVLATVFFIVLRADGQSIDWTNPQEVAAAAADRHPALAELAARTTAARERIRSAASYPNPMVMAGVQNLQVDLANDEMMTMYMLGASQTIPRRERRTTRKESARLESERLELESKSLREEIRRDALFAWYDLAAADGRIAATERLALAVDAVVAAARIRYETGSTIQADILRAQLQRSGIERQLLALAGERRAAASRLLAQLGLPLTTAIPRLELPRSTEGRGIAHDPVIPDDHPALEAVVREVELAEQQVRLARLLGKPDWNVDATYSMRTEQTDMFSVVARVELPFRRNSLIEPQIRAARAEQEAASQRREALRLRLLEALGLAYTEHAEATSQLRLHDEVLLPQTKLAFDSSLAAYQAGRDVFEAVMNTESTWLALESDYLQLLQRHIKAIVDFEAIRRGARNRALGTASLMPPANGLSGAASGGAASSMGGMR